MNIRNIVNDYYARDISFKIKSAKKALMKETQRYDRRLAAAREDAIEVMKTYKQGIEAQRKRMNASHNSFVRTCCRQEIDQLKAEKEAIEAEVIG